MRLPVNRLATEVLKSRSAPDAAQVACTEAVLLAMETGLAYLLFSSFLRDATEVTTRRISFTRLILKLWFFRQRISASQT
jgi:hypothetical protein